MDGVGWVALGIHIEKLSSLCAPVPVLFFSLFKYVKLVQEGLDTTFVLDTQKYILEVLSEGNIVVAVSLAWCISDFSTA